MLSDDQVKNIVLSELAGAVSYIGDSELSTNRETLLDYYNQKPYGDEQEGQSQVVTSDVADVVETMLADMMRLFTQGDVIGQVKPAGQGTDEEAGQKTKLVNYVFIQQNNGELLLHNMFKDAILQYTGWIKAYWDESERTEFRRYKGLSAQEYALLLEDDSLTLTEDEEVETELGTVYNVSVEKKFTDGCLKYVGIPPEECLINDDARDFYSPRFIGQRSPKTRSELIEMGFDEDTVNSLPADYVFNEYGEKQARYGEVESVGGENTHKPNDQIYLTECYIKLDVNEDGIAEYYQVFIAGSHLLDKQRVDDHPFCCITPIPIPHRAIGNCPAAQVADIQYWKSTLVRQMNNNIYQVNFARTVANQRVNYDDLLNPVAGGIIRVEDEGSVHDAMSPFVVQPQTDAILQGIEYADSSREIRTGVTRYSQGLDGEALNKTATGFLGIQEKAQQRTELIARIFAATGVRDIFKKGIKILSQYQDTPLQIRVSGAPMEIDPRAWRHDLDCVVNVGLGSGERAERINNLNYILQLQKEFISMGVPVAAPTQLYNTLERLISAAGLRDASQYFIDPAREDQLLEVENEQLKRMIQELEAQVNNPITQAEQIRAQARLQETAMKQSAEMAQFEQEQELERQKAIQSEATKRTELELKYNQNVPGSAV